MITKSNNKNKEKKLLTKFLKEEMIFKNKAKLIKRHYERIAYKLPNLKTEFML